MEKVNVKSCPRWVGVLKEWDIKSIIADISKNQNGVPQRSQFGYNQNELIGGGGLYWKWWKNARWQRERLDRHAGTIKLISGKQKLRKKKLLKNTKHYKNALWYILNKRNRETCIVITQPRQLTNANKYQRKDRIPFWFCLLQQQQ